MISSTKNDQNVTKMTRLSCSSRNWSIDDIHCFQRHYRPILLFPWPPVKLTTEMIAARESLEQGSQTQIAPSGKWRLMK